MFRNFPISELHPQAVNAATTAEFGATKNRYWEIHDALFENQRHLGGPLYDAIVTKLGLSVEELHESLESNVYEEKIREDFNGGVRSGVNGTPTFFINGERYDGPPDVESMTGALKKAVESLPTDR